MMKGSVEFTADGRLNTKQRRMKDLRASFRDAPEPYRSTSTKEELCFEYINNFKRQFQQLYPTRKNILLTPENEFGVKKFVCTTLRPSKLPYPNFYDMYECASFLSSYVLYEPLDPPTALPKALFSPTRTLESHSGDSFDLSCLLCSFLIGYGYKAYVVSGYAPKHITLRDQSATQCPIKSQTMASSLSSPSKQSASSEIKVDGSGGSIENVESSEQRYVAPDNSVKESTYIAAENEKRRIAGLDPFVLWIPDEMDPKKLKRNIALSYDDEKAQSEKRVHAWVLVCAGARDVKEHVFIEASTGRAYSPKHSPYLGIESVWNHLNYWINVTPDKKVGQMEFDLENGNLWEYMFVSTAKPATDTNAAVDDPMSLPIDDPNAAEAAKEEKGAAIRPFDCPPTWVNALELGRKSYTLQYPPCGKRTVQYFKTKVDYYARGVNSQCMVMRVVCYLDIEQNIVSEVHEWFENRYDKMYKRERYFLNKAHFVEHYHPGNGYEIKKWTEYPGKEIHIDFYVSGHKERLLKRVEKIGHSVEEIFDGRPDYMIYRYVEMTVDRLVAGQRASAHHFSGYSLADEIYILKMVQKYERNPNVEYGSDIEKRTFFVREGKIIVDYHLKEGEVAAARKTYIHAKVPNTSTTNELALTQEVGVIEDAQQLQDAMAMERECFQGIKQSWVHQNEKICDVRQTIENDVPMSLNVFDKALDEAMSAPSATSLAARGGDAAGPKDSKSTDYLTPFLRHVRDVNNITREEAVEIRQNCLDAMEARKVERCNIIQARLQDEHNRLARKQEAFQRSQRDGELSTEEYERFLTEAMFRIKILDQRLAEQYEKATKKFRELEAKLVKDERLRVLRSV